MKIRRWLANAALCALACSTQIALPSVAAAAKSQIATDSSVFVERKPTDTRRRLEPAEKLLPGDKVVTIVTWHRTGGRGAFTIVNPLPEALSYQRSAMQAEEEEVSVDGGRTWGRLPQLRIGDRHAISEDVTHVRWRISGPSALRGTGRIAYSGIVR